MTIFNVNLDESESNPSFSCLICFTSIASKDISIFVNFGFKICKSDWLLEKFHSKLEKFHSKPEKFHSKLEMFHSKRETFEVNWWEFLDCFWWCSNFLKFWKLKCQRIFYHQIWTKSFMSSWIYLRNPILKQYPQSCYRLNCLTVSQYLGELK